jgi:ubiquinone/menaquinone biosynthesis C-methylase UbiE
MTDKNPWLTIPLADLEGHMAHPGVAQARLLSELFGEVVHCFSPRSVAVPGCAGGNGFDRIDPLVTTRVVGIDLNPGYILETKRRFSGTLPGLELHIGDIQSDEFFVSPVDLVFIALLFEYVDVGTALAKIRPILKVNGRMVTVVQLPNEAIPEVTPTPFESVRTLSSIMHLVLPDRLVQLAAAQGYRLIESRTVASAGGKRFQVQVFKVAKQERFTD